MPNPGVVLAKMRKLCESLPDTKLTFPWGEPHFRVGEKIFLGVYAVGDVSYLTFKLEMAHAKAMLKDKRFKKADYVGRYGWVRMNASAVKDWKEVRALVEESYRLIAKRQAPKNCDK